MENPFDDDFFASVNSSLDALDQAADKQAHDSKYTADGVLLEVGLEVWCVDNTLGKEPWTLKSYQKNYGTWFIVFDEGRKGKRDARYTIMYADKSKAKNARKSKLAAEILEIYDEQISSLAKELEELENNE
jgi:hypothetical protein